MLCTLFNIQVLVIVAESSGHVHTFASDRAQSLILSDDARQLLTGGLSIAMNISPENATSSIAPGSWGTAREATEVPGGGGCCCSSCGGSSDTDSLSE